MELVSVSVPCFLDRKYLGMCYNVSFYQLHCTAKILKVPSCCTCCRNGFFTSGHCCVMTNVIVA